MAQLEKPILPLAYPKAQSVGATGDWAVNQPLIDLHKCTKCGICLLSCPEGAIKLDEDDFPVIDYQVCKGCYVCRHECGPSAMEQEKK
jgi:pyruvate ferredoxin oxidoreductase delta subunit